MTFPVLIKTGFPTTFSRGFQDKQTTAELKLPVTSNMQQIKMWLIVVVFLSRKKCYAKQSCVLTGFMIAPF